MSTSHYEYSFFCIAKNNVIVSSAKKYKQLCLQALSVALTSFSPTYKIKSALTDEEWITCLAVNGNETFICTATSIKTNTSKPHTPEQTIWVGQLTLCDLQSWEDFILPKESGQKNPMEDGDKELWQMLSLFTLPNHHGQGLGKKLCQEALGYLALYQESPHEVWVRLMVKLGNHAMVSLYQGLGFVDIGKCTLAEALIVNGDKDLLLKDINGLKYSVRSGLIMMLEICCL